MLINYPTKCFQRTTDDRTAGSLDNFFGDSSWRNALVEGEAIDSDKALAIYEEKLRRAFWHFRGKAPYVSSIRVGMQNYFYDLILCCKKGDYIDAWEDLKTKTYWRDPSIPRNACLLLSGKSSILDEYIIPFEQKKPAEIGPKYKQLSDF